MNILLEASGVRCQVSVPPLADEATGLIEKETTERRTSNHAKA